MPRADHPWVDHFAPRGDRISYRTDTNNWRAATNATKQTALAINTPLMIFMLLLLLFFVF
jgi:hypothetical protein